MPLVRFITSGLFTLLNVSDWQWAYVAFPRRGERFRFDIRCAPLHHVRCPVETPTIARAMLGLSESLETRTNLVPRPLGMFAVPVPVAFSTNIGQSVIAELDVRNGVL